MMYPVRTKMQINKKIREILRYILFKFALFYLVFFNAIDVESTVDFKKKLMSLSSDINAKEYEVFPF